MVDLIDAYRIIDKAILDVANDLVPLEQLELDVNPVVMRLHEMPYDLAARNARIKPVVVAHDLRQYVQRFYSIQIEDSEKCLLDILIDINTEDIDLSELGGDL